MSDFQLYGAAYLALSFLVSLWLWRYFKKETKQSPFVRDALNALRPPRPPRRFESVREALVMITVVSANTVIWPIFVGNILTRRWLAHKAAPTVEATPLRERHEDLAEARGYLSERLSVAEIEAREMIKDPLSAVPSVPFGHLYVAWLAFKSRHVEADGFWAFSIEREFGDGNYRLAGYAVLDGTNVIDEFLTEGH